MTTRLPKLPIILYEEPKPGEPANPIPYIELGIDDPEPKVLFISLYKETGEFEVDATHGQVAIVETMIHKFVDLDHLKDVLKPKTYDQVRVALGMKPLKQAQKAGQRIIDRAQKAAEARAKQLETDNSERQKRAFTLGEDLRVKAENFKREFEKERQKEKEEDSK